MTVAEDRKIGLGMLSTQMQRVERAVTGRNKGPPPISADPQLFSVVAPVPEASPRRRRHKLQPEEHPKEFSSGTDLLWRPSADGNPGPSRPPPQRQQFARFIPSANRGKPTSHATLTAMAERKSRDVASRAHAARAPAQLAVRLSPQVLAMCKEYQIDIRALMREGANPLSEHVPQMHGPYTPSWDVAIGAFDAQEDEGPRKPPTSARSAPGSGRKYGTKGGGEGEGSKSGRGGLRPRPPPKPTLEAQDIAEVQRQLGPELEELRRQRQTAMRRRAAISLAQQRKNAESVEKEREYDEWREQHAATKQRQLDRACLARKTTLREAEEKCQQRVDGIKGSAKAEAKQAREEIARDCF